MKDAPCCQHLISSSQALSCSPSSSRACLNQHDVGFKFKDQGKRWGGEGGVKSLELESSCYSVKYLINQITGLVLREFKLWLETNLWKLKLEEI